MPTVYKTYCALSLWESWFNAYLGMMNSLLNHHGGSDVLTRQPLMNSDMFVSRAHDLEDFMYGEDEKYSTSTVIVL